MDAIRWFSEYLTLVISSLNNLSAFYIFECIKNVLKQNISV